MIKESETIELKKSLSQLREGIISLGAMLNKSNYGEVYFGINDDGRVTGLMIGKKTIADVTHEIHNNLKPLPIKLTINPVSCEGKDIIKVLRKEMIHHMLHMVDIMYALMMQIF